MQISSEILGIITGILTTAAAFLARQFWIKVAEPYVQNHLYQSAEIEGLWRTCICFEDGGYNKHRIQIRRIGYKISGTMECIDGYSLGQSWDFEGVFKNLIFSATYMANNRRNIEIGAMALRYDMMVGGNNTPVLNGHLAYFDDYENKVKTVPMRLFPVAPTSQKNNHSSTIKLTCSKDNEFREISCRVNNNVNSEIKTPANVGESSQQTCEAPR